MPKEGWYVLKSIDKNTSARELAKEYGMEELAKYKLRSIREMDRMRAAAN